MPRLMRFTYYWLPILVYCLLIFMQSSFPATEHVPDFDVADKLLHAGAFAVLGFLLLRALNTGDKRFSTIRMAGLSIFLTALYGASDEIHQYFVPTRSAEFLDFAADAVGGVFGVMIAVTFYKRRRLK